jgi:egghead protein (zeste-white 4 protein)
LSHTYNPMVQSLIMNILTIIWLLNIPIAFIAITRCILNNKVFVLKNPIRIYNDPTIIFQITTRSATDTPVVLRGIRSIMDSSDQVRYRKYLISVVTEDTRDIQNLRDLKCDVVVVDKSFKTSAIKKGRALQYGVVHRRRCLQNDKSYWIFHLDDESFLTPQTILSLLKFIREGNGVAAEGPIFYPLKFESANFLTALAESVRPFSCYDCVSQMTNGAIIKTPPLHMHGSNLLVRSDVEDSIGWDFGPTLAEDQLFGYKIYQKYGADSLGWHGGILLEQPPLNIKDHFMQRRRWVVGSLQNIDKFTSVHRLKVIYKLTTYFLGFAAGITSIALSLLMHIPFILTLLAANGIAGPASIDMMSSTFNKTVDVFYSESILHLWSGGPSYEVATASLIFISSLVWLFSYQLGLFLNLRYSKVKLGKKFLMHIQTLILCPILGLIETFPAFFAIIEYNFRKRSANNESAPIYDFYVINK